jgi:hypothetical protein
MTDHNLEVGAIVDLDIDGRSVTGGLESDGSIWADIGKEAALVPRCLPLSPHHKSTWSTKLHNEAENTTNHIVDTLGSDRKNKGKQGANAKEAPHRERPGGIS